MMFDLTPFKRRNEDVFDNMLRSFNDAFERSGWAPLNGNVQPFKTDIVEKDDAYYVEADLPGFSKEDIQINLENNQLSIRAKRNDSNEQKDENDKVIRQERNYGEFVRNFYVDNIDQDAISANLEHGILKMTLPKLQAKKPQSKQIEIN